MGDKNSKYMDSKFRESVESSYADLHNKDEAEDFELSFEFQDGVKSTFIGKRSDATYWGDGKYSVDFGVEMEIEDDVEWDEVDIETFEDTAKDIIQRTAGYSGPVILRQDSSPNKIEWARRMIFELENEE